MAAGLAERPYTLGELLRTPVHPVPLAAPAPSRRGRPAPRGRLIPFPASPSRPPGRVIA